MDADPAGPKAALPAAPAEGSERCAVARNPLNLKIHPVYVNGRPVGFC